MNGWKALAVGDSLWFGLVEVELAMNGSLSEVCWAAAERKASLDLPGNRSGCGADELRDSVLYSLLDLAEPSSGEKAVRRVSGVPSCL